MAARRLPMQLDALPHVVNDVIVTTGKAFKAARPDGKGNPAEASAVLEAKIPPAVEKFNSFLDDLEGDILRAKAVLLRDLNQLRAKRNPPAPEQKPVAPPAPMAVDVQSPVLTAKEPLTGQPGAALAASQASKPVAPFPNMGFDGTSPEVAPAPSPKTAPKPKDARNLGKPAVTAAAVGRPSSVPPKKEAKVPAAQVQRPSGAATAPQTPLISAAQNKAIPVAAPNRPGPATGPGSAVATSTTPSQSGSEKLFTDMTFSLAPPPGDVQAQKQTPQAQRRPSQQQQQQQQQLQQQQPPQQPPQTAETIDLTDGPSENLPVANTGQSLTGPTDVVAMDLDKLGEDSGMIDADAKIDELFDLGSGDMDQINHDYDFGNGDSSNFNDMFFPTGDSSGGAGDLDDAFFNLDG